AIEPRREGLLELREELAFGQAQAEELGDLLVDPDARLAGRPHASDLQRRLDRHESPNGRARIDQLGLGHQLAKMPGIWPSPQISTRGHSVRSTISRISETHVPRRAEAKLWLLVGVM